MPGAHRAHKLRPTLAGAGLKLKKDRIGAEEQSSRRVWPKAGCGSRAICLCRETSRGCTPYPRRRVPAPAAPLRTIFAASHDRSRVASARSRSPADQPVLPKERDPT